MTRSSRLAACQSLELGRGEHVAMFAKAILRLEGNGKLDVESAPRHVVYLDRHDCRRWDPLTRPGEGCRLAVALLFGGAFDAKGSG